MDRTTWVHAFITELEILRPHLKPRAGRVSNYVHALASQAYSTTADPIAAARALHERMGPPPEQKEDRPATRGQRGEKAGPG